MVLSILSIAAMGGMFLYMWCRARFGITRRVALVPLMTCAVEMLAAGLLSVTTFPVLTAVLVLLRLVILGCCVGAMHHDRVMANRRETRKQQFQRQLRCAQHTLTAVPSRRQAPRAGDGSRRRMETCA